MNKKFFGTDGIRGTVNESYLTADTALKLGIAAGKVFTRDVILNKVWGDDIIVGDRTIDVHVRKLREKLGDGYIKTVKGVGYKLKLN